MVAIRLSRTGAEKKPSYRVVVIDKRRARDSRNIEIVGHYNPRLDPIELVLKRDRIAHWMGVGAQPSSTVQRLVKYFDKRERTAEAEASTNGAEAVVETPEAAQPAEEAVAGATEPTMPAAPGTPIDDDSAGEGNEFDLATKAVDEQLEAALAEEASGGQAAVAAEDEAVESPDAVEEAEPAAEPAPPADEKGTK